MAINCKICGRELDVFSGGRCRKCRSLVCRDCTASGGASSSQGLLCKNCAAAEAALAGENPAPAARAETGAGFQAPAWLWVALPAAAALIFAVLVGWPWVTAQLCLRALRQGEPPEAEAAAEKLSRISGGYVVRELCALAEREAAPLRARAIRALGKIPQLEARDFLLRLREAPSTPAELRSLLVEALREQERRGWRDAEPAGAAEPR